MLQFSIPWCFVDTMIDLVFSQLVLFLVSSLNFTTIKKKKICSKPCHSKMYRRVVQKCTVGFYYEAPVFFQWNGEDRYTLVLLFDPVVSGEKLHEQQKTQKKTIFSETFIPVKCKHVCNLVSVKASVYV